MVDTLVTVIIVNYNAGEMLRLCIEHLLKSTIPVKIIVSDNASTDNSLNLLEQSNLLKTNLIIHRNHTNIGFARANNAVYPQINTPFVLYLNPDCFIGKDSIQHLIHTMYEYPEAGMVGCLVTNINGTEQIGCRGLTPTPRRVINQLLHLNKVFSDNPNFQGYLTSDKELPSKPIEVELISGSCMFVRKKAINEVGLLDDSYFLYCEDYDWFYRFKQSKWKILFTPKTKVKHIKSYSTKQMPFKVLVYKAKGMWKYYNKFFQNNFSPCTTLVIKAGIIGRLVILSCIMIIKKIIHFRPIK